MLQSLSLGPFALPIPFLIILISYGLMRMSIWLAFNSESNQKIWLYRLLDHSLYIGLISARIGFGLLNWPAYQQQPWQWLYLWQPGYWWELGIISATLFAAIRIAFHFRINGLKAIALVLLGLMSYGGANLALERRQQAYYQTQTEYLRIPLIQLHNQQTTVLANWVGRPMIINIWASWCGPCRREMPMLQGLYQQWQRLPEAEQPLLVAVNLQESADTIHRFIQEQLSSTDWQVPIWQDSQGHFAQSVAQEAGVVTPTTLFIDAQGNLVQIKVGELSKAYVSAQLERLKTKP